ncbi:hypothetical protein ACMT1E_13670 [Sphingomonas flavalba]|uniref:hypothetical protein n=1 Tax=Sphingomonas flavalba TaxID=2559804 RepID=UPI0039E1E0E2
MAAAAAADAGAHPRRPVHLLRCEAVELRGASAPGAVTVESWVVRRTGATVTMAVLATAAQPGGGARIAGSGRFTFTRYTAETKEQPA